MRGEKQRKIEKVGNGMRGTGTTKEGQREKRKREKKERRRDFCPPVSFLTSKKKTLTR